ncbi:MAG: xanthine dehydrogenase family protein subunit M [Caldilineaceae bacterium]
MYPTQFDYARAGSVEEAISLGSADGAKFVAGGHSLIPAMKLRLSTPSTLVDIGRLSGLKGISRNGNSVRVGALTTHAACAASGDLPKVWSEAAGLIGDPQVRNRGTVGGNIAHADPASDLPTVLTALRANVNIQGAGGSRSVSADDFFVDLFTTALQEGEIITSVDVSAEGNRGSAYVKLFNPASRYAIVGVAVQVEVAGGVCKSASVAIGGCTNKATRASGVEAALVGKTLDDATINAAAAAIASDLGDEVNGDMHASAEYRKAVAPGLVAQAIKTAVGRAK